MEAKVNALSKASAGRVSQDSPSAAGDLMLNTREHPGSYTPNSISKHPHKRARLTRDDVETASTDSSIADKLDGEILQPLRLLQQLQDDMIVFPGPMSDRMTAGYERVLRQIDARIPPEDNSEDEMEDESKEEEEDEEEQMFMIMKMRQSQQEIGGIFGKRLILIPMMTCLSLI